MRRCAIFCGLLITACSEDPAPAGARGGPCYGNGTCNGELVCNADRICERAPNPPGDDAEPAADRDGGMIPDGAIDPDATTPSGDSGAHDDASTTPRDAGPLTYVPPLGCFRASPTVREVERQAVVVAPNGDVHVALGGDGVYYGYLAAGGTSFAMELVDAHGGPASIVLDASHRPVIAYWDQFAIHRPLVADVEGLKLAQKTAGGAWAIESLWPEHPRISPQSDNSDAPSIAIDAGGTIHFAFTTPAADRTIQLELATWDGAQFSHSPYSRFPADTYIYSEGLEIGVDATGEPMVAVTGSYTKLWLLRRVMGEWRDPELVAQAMLNNLDSSMFVDGAGRPGFVLRGGPTGNRVEVWRQTAVGWDIVDCSPAGAGGIYRGGRLGDGTPGFLSYHWVASTREYFLSFVRAGTSCTAEHVARRDFPAYTRTETEAADHLNPYAMAFSAAADTWASLVLDQAGGQVLAYVSFDGGATHSAISMLPIAVHGLAPAIALKADGSPVIASVEAVRGALELATWNPARSDFDVEEVPAGDPGDHCYVKDARLGAVSIAVHSTGDVLIAYQRSCDDSTDVVMSRKAPFGWVQETIGPAAYPPLHLVLQPNGRPAIGTALHVFEFDGASWQSVMSPAWQANDYTELDVAYDELGRMVVAGADRRDIMVARRDAAGSWAIDRIDMNANVVDSPRYPISIAIDGTGVWHTAYGRYLESTTERFYPGPNEIRLAKRDASGWTSATIDTASADLRSTALEGVRMALDGDRPVIAFRSHLESSLVLAAPDGMGGFLERTLAEDGNTGLYPALAVRGGTAHVAFHHAGTGDLCYTNSPVP